MSPLRATSVFLTALAVVIPASSSIVLAAGDRQATNIAPAPGAEKAGADELPAGWTGKLPKGWGCYDNTPAEVGVSDKVFHSGKCSAYLKITKFRDDDRVNTALAVGRTHKGYKGPDAIAVKPSTKYYFSFYIKGGGFTRKINVGPWGYKSDGSGLDRSMGGVSLVPTEKWTHYVGSFTTGAEIGRVVLMFKVYGRKDADIKPGAIFYIDDVYIGASEADAKAEVPAAPQPKPAVPVFKPIEAPKLPPGTLVGYSPLKAGEVRIWDTGKQYQAFWQSFKNKATWIQVPHGKKDYKFRGDTILENKFFYIAFNGRGQDDLHVKKDKHTLWRNVFYRCHYPDKMVVGGVKEYQTSPESVKIVKYTPGEMLVEEHGQAHRRRYAMACSYQILHDKPWVMVRPVKKAHMLGIHGKVRMALAVVEDGDDYVIDSLRDPDDAYVPPKGRLIICFYESVKNPFMWVLTFPSFKRANTYFNCDSGPGGDTMWCDPGTRGGLTIPRKWPGCVTATYSRFGKQTEPVVEGALAYWNNWYREHPDKPIKKGETYTSKWKPPYPGRWRMTVRIAEKKYDQGFKYDGKTRFPAKYFSKDVYDGNFTFTSPIDGHLDYVIMYMYDRTKQTPKNILTPMDQHRWTIQQEKRKKD